VAIYMGMVPEIAIAMLACARIGAVHTVIFGGFAAEAVRDRVNDAEAKVVVTQDGAWRRGTVVPLKANVDKALAERPACGTRGAQAHQQRDHHGARSRPLLARG
jgi:acetyl-CoA synthetase